MLQSLGIVRLIPFLERKSTNIFTFVPAPPLFVLFRGVLGPCGVPGLVFLFLFGGVSELGDSVLRYEIAPGSSAINFSPLFQQGRGIRNVFLFNTGTLGLGEVNIQFRMSSRGQDVLLSPFGQLASVVHYILRALVGIDILFAY